MDLNLLFSVAQLVLVMTVCPAWLRTRGALQAAMIHGGTISGGKRVWSTEDVAEVCSYLRSTSSGYYTGTKFGSILALFGSPSQHAILVSDLNCHYGTTGLQRAHPAHQFEPCGALWVQHPPEI